MNLSLANIEQQIGAVFSDAPAVDRPQRDASRNPDITAANRTPNELKGECEERPSRRAPTTDL